MKKTVSRTYYKTSLLMNDNIKLTKLFTQCASTRTTAIRYGLDLDADALGKAFYDAFVMSYLPNVTKRYQEWSVEVEAIEDIYGNTIEMVFDDNIAHIYIEENVTPELEQMYEKLVINALEKVQRYGKDMEIGR
jgi:hypothetical protein